MLKREYKTMKTMKFPFEERKYESLERIKGITNSNYGKLPQERTIKELFDSGLILINKPQGPTSHQVSDYIKNILDINKAGHSGSLDPNVTGLLVVTLGKATRAAEFLLKGGKEYICLMHIHTKIDEKLIRNKFNDIVGKIQQLPPLKSAVKRQVRTREIYYIEILEIEDQDVLFRVGCEAGTYIRRLCFPPEIELFTNKGIKTIEEVYNSKENLEVFSFSNGKLIPEKIIDFQKFNFSGELVEINTCSGIKILSTPEHKFLISNTKENIMKEASQLMEGEYLIRAITLPFISKIKFISELLDDNYLIHDNKLKLLCKNALIKKYGSIREMNRKEHIDRKPFCKSSKVDIRIKHLKLANLWDRYKSKISCFKTEKGNIIRISPKLNPDLMYLIGLIASDGNNTKEKKTTRYTRIRFYNLETELIDLFYKIYLKLFPTTHITKKFKSNSIWEIQTSNSLFATICSSLGVISPSNKSDLLPILELDSKLIASFLKGYFDGDGNVFIKEHENGTILCEIRYFSVDYINIKRIHQMLLKLGINNKITKRSLAYSSFHSKNNFYYTLFVTDPASKLLFCNLIGSNHPKKKLFISRLKKYFNNSGSNSKDYLYCLLNQNKYLNEFKSITKLGGNFCRIKSKSIPMRRSFFNKFCSLKPNIPKNQDEFTLDKIRSIKKIKYKGPVYDITVDKEHNFTIENGIVTSNCDDFGKSLNTKAHMQELVRTRVCNFYSDDWVTLHDLKDAYEYYKEGDESHLKKIIQPYEQAVSHLKKIYLNDNAIDTICHGAFLSVPGIVKLDSDIDVNDTVALFTLKNELVAVGKAKMNSQNILKQEKGIAVTDNKVFMEPNIYPKFKKNETSTHSN